MELCEKKHSMIYRNENGVKIMVRISLPGTDCDCELNFFYSELLKRYILSAKKFIEGISGDCKETYFYSVRYKTETEKKKLRIRRYAILKLGASVVKECEFSDFFDKATLRLRK